METNEKVFETSSGNLLAAVFVFSIFFLTKAKLFWMTPVSLA